MPGLPSCPAPPGWRFSWVHAPRPTVGESKAELSRRLCRDPDSWLRWERAADVVLLVDPHGRIREATGAAQELFGRGGDYLRGESFSALCLPAARASLSENLGRAARGGPHLFSTQIVRGDGVVVPGRGELARRLRRDRGSAGLHRSGHHRPGPQLSGGASGARERDPQAATATRAVAEARGGGPHGEWHGPRLQQPAQRDHGLCGAPGPLAAPGPTPGGPASTTSCKPRCGPGRSRAAS